MIIFRSLTLLLLFLASSLTQAKPQLDQCGIYQLSGKLSCQKSCELQLHPGTLSETKIALNQDDSDLLSAIYKNDLIQLHLKFISKGKAEVVRERLVQRVAFNSALLKQTPTPLKEWPCQK